MIKHNYFITFLCFTVYGTTGTVAMVDLIAFLGCKSFSVCKINFRYRYNFIKSSHDKNNGNFKTIWTNM